MLVRRARMTRAKDAGGLSRVREIDLPNRYPAGIELPQLVNPLVHPIPSYHGMRTSACRGIRTGHPRRLAPFQQLGPVRITGMDPAMGPGCACSGSQHPVAPCSGGTTV